MGFDPAGDIRDNDILVTMNPHHEVKIARVKEWAEDPGANPVWKEILVALANYRMGIR